MRTLILSSVIVTTACTANVEIISEDTDATAGASVSDTRRLTGCRGKASSAIPDDGRYVVTTFGGPSSRSQMSCGGYANGTGWYAASRQRYGCGSHIRVQANGKCVVLKTDDYGPDICVENAAHMPIMDVSPAAAKALFGVSGAGWSDHLVVTVEEVSTNEPLGVCATGGTTGDSAGGTSCASATLGREVSAGTCVQAASDGLWYECSNAIWQLRSSSAGCASAYAWCDSATLGTQVPSRSCVQSAATSTWYQCNGQGWVKPVDAGARTGPIGPCLTMYPL